MSRLFAIVPVLLVGLLAWLPDSPAQEEKVKPTPLPVNTDADEDEPHVAENGLTLYFTTNRGKNDDLWFATRKVAGGAWGKARQLEGYFKEGDDYRGAFATGGTFPHYLYVATRDKEGKNYDLFFSIRQDRGKAWIAPAPVMKVNSRQDEQHPWVAGNGKALYFSRKSKDGWVQMVSNRTTARGPQGWQEPEEVGLPVGFHHATLTKDGSTMYVQGPLEKGRWGLFVVRRDGKTWGKPEPLDAVNHPDGKTGDRSPSLSRDGRFLYFASDRPGGKGGLDLYYVPTAKLK